MAHTAPRAAHVAGWFALLAVMVAALVVVVAGSASASQWAGEEQRLVERINAERRGAGLGTLQVDAELQRVARAWTDVMVRDNRLYHNPNLSAQVNRSWQRLGENVGWTQQSGMSSMQMTDQVHSMFMGSPGHRANVLRGEFGWVGVGVRVTPAGRLWTTVTFMQGTGSPPPPPPPPPLGPGEFRDVDGGTHAPAIRAIALRGVTQGCAAELFCPERQVTRGQMASFLTRALNLPEASGRQFIDTARTPHAAAIESLAAAGITSGCGPGRFCPNEPVSRSQMASFIQRAWDLPVASVSAFSDVVSSVHQPAIDAIAEAGITRGCALGLFCPNEAVSRGEMASFLARALGLV